ncbi:MAG: hypothetical protein ACOX83_10755 [Candidatus Spyradocola sp.]|jgi:hypothetical protein
MYSVICGVKCVSSLDACGEFHAENNELRAFRQQGMPYLKVGRYYYYPLDLCHRWFNGEQLKQEKRTLANAVHEAARTRPRAEWMKEATP